MKVRYDFVVYGGSFQELGDAARAGAEKMFGYPPAAEAFAQFDVCDFASAFAGQPAIYRADVAVEMDFA